MKKVGLLLLSASLAATSFASDAIYLIKDGKLQNGVTYASWTDAEGIPCATLTEGDGFATLVQQGTYYDAKLTIDQSVLNFDLMGRNLVVEYQLPSEAMLYDASMEAQANNTASKKDKPALIISASAGEDDDAKFEYKDANSISFVNVDGKFNPAAEKGFVTYNGCAFAKSARPVSSVFLAYNRELAYKEGGQAPMKIKNLYYEYPNDVQPFFSCAFDSDNTWIESINMFATNPDGSMNALCGSFFFQDQKGMVIKGDTKGSYAVVFKMLYENGDDNWTGSDGSGFLSSELYHGLLVMSPLDFPKKFKEQTIDLLFEDIALPATMKGGEISISALVKADPKTSAILKGDETEKIPMFVKFDNDDKEIQIFGDSIINGLYTQESATISVPAGASKFSIIFKSHPEISYVVDNLICAANYKNSVAQVNGDSKSLSIYPNPVVEAISFDGVESIESVKIVSMNGAAVECAVVDGKVNVSNLAAGEYVIIVNNAISGKFIKK